jgi:solute carrier family 25 (adenine nucleotide translocator) protein 4/5/6/31
LLISLFVVFSLFYLVSSVCVILFLVLPVTTSIFNPLHPCPCLISPVFVFPHTLFRRLATDIGAEEKGVPRRFLGTFDCFVKTYHHEGIRGLYSGLGISLFGVVIFKAFYLGGYDSLKHSFDLDQQSMMMRYVAAQFITTTVGTICYPIDTIKRRLMIQQGLSSPTSSCSSAAARSGASVTKHYRNSIDCFRQILKQEGIRGLFSGLSVNLFRGISGALLLVGYDEVKKIMNVYG